MLAVAIMSAVLASPKVGWLSKSNEYSVLTAAGKAHRWAGCGSWEERAQLFGEQTSPKALPQFNGCCALGTHPWHPLRWMRMALLVVCCGGMLWELD